MRHTVYIAIVAMNVAGRWTNSAEEMTLHSMSHNLGVFKAN